ncbi:MULTISPECIES: cytochrome d ubiquinol oxidase subunit II [Kribbella]|uniref:Cytochrome d ubiquinol oxidase subunit II n=1 Tax=Kribbella karoonensis TaxID=324851 RepID=A0ABN2D3V1_9ACTN
MELTTVWFIAIAMLWTGYFVLEGFDFGVGMLYRVLGRNETERRAAIETIGPVWDGNEVWLIMAGAATFAAFPEWYATLFSGFYLPLFFILVGLIVRGVALEYRGKRDDPVWRSRMDGMIVAGSVLPALLWGVAFGNIVRGVPLDARHEYVGSFGTLLNPFALLGGLTFVAVFVTHGAIFLALRTTDDLRVRANRLATRAGAVAAVLTIAFLVWAQELRGGDTASLVLTVAAIAAFAGGLVANLLRREGWAFVGTTLAIGLAVVSLFVALFPDVMPSTLPGTSLTAADAASSPYTLKAMTIITAIFLPLVMLYQGWTYWVFRKRVVAA